jgi:hypothetical protein
MKEKEMKKRILLSCLLALLTTSCSLPSAGETTPPVIPVSPTPTQETPGLPVETPPMEWTPTPQPQIEYEEAILILEPGPGSTVTSPVRVSGIADPTFEQNLVIQVINIDGEVLTIQPTQIQADIGERGPFESEISIEINETTQAWIQVYTTSARDGGITHLHSVAVFLAPEGPEQIRIVEPHQERIIIFSPSNNEELRNGSVTIEGFALASFEQHLLAEVMDSEGRVIGFAPITVQAPDLGRPGPFVVTLPYEAGTSGPGRIVVRDPSVAFPGDMHLSSVEIQFVP